MQPTCLLLTRDDQVMRLLRHLAGELAIQLEVCTGPDHAADDLAHRHFDFVFIDCDDVHKAPDVLRNVHSAQLNQHAAAIAIVNGITSASAATGMGADTVLAKPLDQAQTRSALEKLRG